MRLNNTDCVCFPCAAYELQHSSDLALMTKWPVFLQNAFGNPAYVNQTNLNGKLRKNRRVQTGVQEKIWENGSPSPPLESPLDVLHCKTPHVFGACVELRLWLTMWMCCIVKHLLYLALVLNYFSHLALQMCCVAKHLLHLELVLNCWTTNINWQCECAAL